MIQHQLGGGALGDDPAAAWVGAGADADDVVGAARPGPASGSPGPRCRVTQAPVVKTVALRIDFACFCYVRRSVAHNEAATIIDPPIQPVMLSDSLSQ